MSVAQGLIMARSTVARATARFRQLSCLGLGSELVIPALLNELHAIIPSHANTFFFADAAGETANIHFENPGFAKVLPLYQSEFLDRRDREYRGLSFAEAGRTQFGVHEFQGAVQVETKTFQRSDFYNLILRPAGNDTNFLRLVFRHGERVLGALCMWRSTGAGIWTDTEKRLLASLETFFVHALTAGMASEGPLVDSGRIGLIVANAEGRTVHVSAEGRRLLFYATHAEIGHDTAAGQEVVLPAPLVMLCKSLSRIFSDDASAIAPSYRCANIWGGFTFRAQWLDADDPASGLVGITISHTVPLPIRLMRSLKQLPLSRRQSEVCVLMATGASSETVAEQLGISKNTVIAHSRGIYDKLDVHNRSEMLTKLLAM
jgi:DNA-binding CsgD family transcriptional regulator